MLPDKVPASEYAICADALGLQGPQIVHALSIKETHNRSENPWSIRREDHKWRQYRFASREAKAWDKLRVSPHLSERWNAFRAMDAICRADALLNPRAENAAILSHSFGWPQIMGFNHRHAGYEDPRNFLKAMQTLEGQRECFIAMVRDDAALHEAFRREDFEAIGLHWNGPAYRRNRYAQDVRQIVAGLRYEGHAYA